MKLRSILAAFAIMASGSLFAQNATKADLAKLENQVNALSQKVSQLEVNLERVITENVNLVEQLNVKTVTSVTDNNGLQWDIVKVEPFDNNVKISLRLSNNSGVNKRLYCIGTGSLNSDCYALDTNTNLDNNKYGVKIYIQEGIESGFPKNFTLDVLNVPNSCSYLSMIKIEYDENVTRKRGVIKFTGVHIPW